MAVKKIGNEHHRTDKKGDKATHTICYFLEKVVGICFYPCNRLVIEYRHLSTSGHGRTSQR